MDVTEDSNCIIEYLGLVLDSRLRRRGGENGEQLLELGIDFRTAAARMRVVGVLALAIV